MKCFKVTDSLHELSTLSDWEITSLSHVLLHTDVPNQQLYHLPLLITPVHCVYLVTFDLREEKALEKINKAIKHISAYVSYSVPSSFNNLMPSKVYLVGTHREGITLEQKSEFTRNLQDFLKKRNCGLIEKPGDEGFWAVEGDCIDIQKDIDFREIISHSCQPKVPTCQCIKYGEDLRDKFPGEAAVQLSCVSNAEAERFLAFLHDYGFIVYRKYNDLAADDTFVVLQPQYLCELFAKAQELRKKQDSEVTVERLFSKYTDLKRSMQKWFEVFCVRTGLVIEQPMGKSGKNLIFALSRQLESENSDIYSIDRLLVTFKPHGNESCLPKWFFPAFASEFLKALYACSDLYCDATIEQTRITVDLTSACTIHVLEQESCIEIGFQLDAVNWGSNQKTRQMKFKKLQTRCQEVRKVVEDSATRVVKYLNLYGGGIQLGFYHPCDDAKVFGAHVLDKDEETYLQCGSCGKLECTPMQDIWFKNVMDCEEVNGFVCSMLYDLYLTLLFTLF